jgi:hypothetical protein
MKMLEFKKRNSGYLRIDERPNDVWITPCLGRKDHDKPIAIPFSEV